MLNVDTATYQELQDEICTNDDGLYEMFNEEKFLSDGYTVEELREITVKWITNDPDTSFDIPAKEMIYV